MPKQQKVPTEVLRQRYVYDASPRPISMSALADEYGLARSGVADKGIDGKWYEQRQEFRAMVGQKVTDAMGDGWAQVVIHQRDRAINSLMKTLDVYDERLQNGEIKPSTKDAVAVIAALRVLQGDVALTAREVRILDPEDIDLDPSDLADLIARSKNQLTLLGDGNAREGAAELDPTGTEGTGQD